MPRTAGFSRSAACFRGGPATSPAIQAGGAYLTAKLQCRMNLGLSGKVALVTAASRGIGLAVAKTLAAEGARVALVARDATALEQAASEIASSGGRAVPIQGDVSRPADIQRIAAETRRSLGDPSVLVANAGGPQAGPPTALKDEAWVTGFQLTLMSVVRLVQEVLPAMREEGWGRIVNITSLSVREPILRLTISNALRAGVTAYAKTLSQEVAADGVTVNNVAPGYTATDHFLGGIRSDTAKEALLERIPTNRFAEPSEVAAAVAFLASVNAGYITGQTLLVDGGAVKSLM